MSTKRDVGLIGSSDHDSTAGCGMLCSRDAAAVIRILSYVPERVRNSSHVDRTTGHALARLSTFGNGLLLGTALGVIVPE